MLYVSSDSTIQLTRGDTARLSVSILNDLTNSEYVIVCTADSNVYAPGVYGWDLLDS